MLVVRPEIAPYLAMSNAHKERLCFPTGLIECSAMNNLAEHAQSTICHDTDKSEFEEAWVNINLQKQF